MTTHTQKDKILSHLKRGWWITPMQCIDKYRCLTLSQRIGDLIQEGWPVQKDWEKTESARVRKYRLDPKWREIMAV